MNESTRRGFLVFSSTAGASLLLGACRDRAGSELAGAAPSAPAKPSEHKKDEEKNAGEEVGAVEDLMREHGVLRRALVVYRESAIKLRANATSVPPAALEKTAKLFRVFGEDYHEKKLEETFIFPAVQKAGAQAGTEVGALKAQHDRGREITDWILAKVAGGKIGAKAEDIAKALEQFARMYEAHSAREDTLVFPAWKKTMTEKALDEMGEKFEEIEVQQLGHDGFEDAIKQMGAIEAELGIGDLALFTAPAPPRG